MTRFSIADSGDKLVVVENRATLLSYSVENIKVSAGHRVIYTSTASVRDSDANKALRECLEFIAKRETAAA